MRRSPGRRRHQNGWCRLYRERGSEHLPDGEIRRCADERVLVAHGGTSDADVDLDHVRLGDHDIGQKTVEMGGPVIWRSGMDLDSGGVHVDEEIGHPRAGGFRVRPSDLDPEIMAPGIHRPDLLAVHNEGFLSRAACSKRR